MPEPSRGSSASWSPFLFAADGEVVGLVEGRQLDC
jgi:hypothetical protein